MTTDDFFLETPPTDLREALQLLGWHGIVRVTGPDPFRHCPCPNTHLHYMPQCEVTPAGFANYFTALLMREGEKVMILFVEMEMTEVAKVA